MKDNSPVARVNGRPVSNLTLQTVLTNVVSHYVRRGQTVTPEVKRQLRTKVLEQLVERELIFQECIRAARPVDENAVEVQIEELADQFGGHQGLILVLARSGMSLDDVREGIRRDVVVNEFIENVLYPKVVVDPKEVRRYFDDNRPHFRTKERLLVHHISMALPADPASDEVDEARGALESLRRKIADGDDFAAVGKQASTAVHGVTTGDLESVEKGGLIPELDAVAFELAVGEISQIIRSEKGLHILKVSERSSPRDLSFEEASAGIARHLLTQKREALTDEYVAGLRKDAAIEILDQ